MLFLTIIQIILFCRHLKFDLLKLVLLIPFVTDVKYFKNSSNGELCYACAFLTQNFEKFVSDLQNLLFQFIYKSIFYFFRLNLLLSLVPEYEIVHLHSIQKREAPQLLNTSDENIKQKIAEKLLKLEAFGKRHELALQPLNEQLFKGNLKMWSAESDGNGSISYTELPDVSTI